MDRLLATAATSLPSAGVAFSVLSQAEVYLRVLGLVVGIASGLYSIWLMHKRARAGK
jgi:lipoprotein signal peptidase